MKNSFKFLRGGLNSSVDGTYCGVLLNSNVVGHSNIEKAFGKETEKSAIIAAINTLERIKKELELELNNYENK